MASGFVLGNRCSDRALELVHGAYDGLMGIAGVVFHHNRIETHQPGFRRAMDVLAARAASSGFNQKAVRLVES